MASKTKAEGTTILEMWNLSGDDKKASDRTDNLGLLKSNAEGFLIKAKQRRAASAKALKAAMTGSEKTGDFGAIASASLEDKAAKLELDEAFSTFEVMFGEKPTIAAM